MNDKTLFIIISVINVLMWLVVVKHMTAANNLMNCIKAMLNCRKAI